MASSERYQAWFHDPKTNKRYPMWLQLSFFKTSIGGIGKDDIGKFAVIKGELNHKTNEIKFTKAYQKHRDLYSGNVTSWKTPLKANGTWCPEKNTGIKGTWGMVLQGSPTFGAKTNRKQVTPKEKKAVKEKASESGWESWGHSILQWVPVPFIATAWDFGASLFYLATGNVKKAKERIVDAGIDVAWDTAAILTGGAAEVEREVARGAEVAVREGETLARRGSMEFHPAADVEAEVAAERQFQHVREHGAGDGNPNQAGSYSEISRNHSLYGITEADHIPPHSTTIDTTFDIGRGSLPALSIEHELHQGLNRIFGTSGRSELAHETRATIRQFLLRGDMSSALRVNILSSYGYWGYIEAYSSGLERLIQRHINLRQTNGRPFLTSEEANSLISWLRGEVTSYRHFASIGRHSDYLDRVGLQLIQLYNLL